MQHGCAFVFVFAHTDSISISGKGLARPFPIITYNDCVAADLPDTPSPAASFNPPQHSHALSPTPSLGALGDPKTGSERRGKKGEGGGWEGSSRGEKGGEGRAREMGEPKT